MNKLRDSTIVPKSYERVKLAQPHIVPKSIPLLPPSPKSLFLRSWKWHDSTRQPWKWCGPTYLGRGQRVIFVKQGSLIDGVVSRIGKDQHAIFSAEQRSTHSRPREITKRMPPRATSLKRMWKPRNSEPRKEYLDYMNQRNATRRYLWQRTFRMDALGTRIRGGN